MTVMKEVNEKIYKIIGACMEVHRTLGPGYATDFYRRALEVEFTQKEIPFESGKTVDVTYKGEAVGSVEMDFLVMNDVVLVLRSQEALRDLEIQQMLRYISLTGTSIGLLVNFGNIKIQYKRVLPGHQQREVRKDHYRLSNYREIGRTREGNPAI
ncbi:MAG TPA: GxxExxY protein [bacterium]|nr:GxxExxY protein [bacterium]